MSADVGLAAALARVEVLNRELGRDPAGDPVLAAHRGPEAVSALPILQPGVPAEVPLPAQHMIEHIQGLIEKISARRLEGQERMERYVRMRDSAIGTNWAGDAQSNLDDLQREHDLRMAALDAHEAALRAKVERLQRDPVSMFLPLGTVVRFSKPCNDVNSLGLLLTDGQDEYPEIGSIGVVTGLNHKREWPIAVSLRRDFRTGYGDEVSPSYDRLPTYSVDAEMVEVIGQALLPGGQPCEAYGYVPTPGLNKPDTVSGRESEIIIEADCRF